MMAEPIFNNPLSVGGYYKRPKSKIQNACITVVLYISRLEKKINTSELKLIILTLGPVLGQF